MSTGAAALIAAIVARASAASIVAAEHEVACERCQRTTTEPSLCDHATHCPDCAHEQPCHHCSIEARAGGRG